MRILVNGQEHTLMTPVTIADLLNEMGMSGQKVAVEVNQEIIPRSCHGGHLLADNDRVEVLFAIGGG